MTARRFPWIRRFVEAGGNVLFPPACALCRAPISECDSAAERFRLCEGCAAQMEPPAGDRCRRCDAPVGPHLDTSEGCSLCREERWAFDRVISLGVYEGSLRSAVLRIKRGGGEHLAAGLAEILWQKQRESLSRFQCDAIVPVPHHWWDRARRSHLPPITLARVLAARLGVRTINDVVAKVQRTPPQSQLGRSQRKLNLVRAFSDVRPLPKNVASVLIVDDILTTGATAHRVAKTLRNIGAAQVHVAVIARAIG